MGTGRPRVEPGRPSSGLPAAPALARRAPLEAQPVCGGVQRRHGGAVGPKDAGGALVLRRPRPRRYLGGESGTGRPSHYPKYGHLETCPTLIPALIPTLLSHTMSQVRFDSDESHLHSSAASGLPSVLFAAEGGVLGRMSSQQQQQQQQQGGTAGAASLGQGATRYGSPLSTGGAGGLHVTSALLGERGSGGGGRAAVNSFDIEAGSGGGRDLICVTDSSELIYVRRGS